MLWRSSLFLLAMACHGQTAITQLTSFWEMDITDADRIAWDSKGTAHGTYFGTNFNADTTMFGSGWYRGAGTQLPYNSGGVSVPGSLIDTGSNSFSYCTWVKPSSTASDPYLGRWQAGAGTEARRSWVLGFNAIPGRPQLTYAKTDSTTGTVLLGSPTVSAGSLTFVCMMYDSGTGEVGIAANGGSWTKATPSAPFQVIPAGDVCRHPAGIYDPWYPCTLDFSHIHNQFFPTGSPVIGRTMFWNNYIPTNAELSTLYNSGSGRDASYFGLAFTPPARPLTVTLANASFADDANLTGQTGLYWLQPFPLYQWNPALAASLGNYVWMRSTDHLPSPGVQKMYIGYSSSPSTLPSSWTQCDPPRNMTTFPNMETPMLVWNPDTSLFHLSAHGDKVGTSNPFQQETLIWTSPDLVTWTLAGSLPPDVAGCPTPTYPGGPFCYNHTGYAYIKRNGTGDWVAQSLLTSSEPSGTDGFIRLGLWNSTDGLTWTFDRETQTMVQKMPYRNNQNQRIGGHVNLATSTAVYSHGYFGTPYSELEFNNPAWPLFFHPGTSGNDFLQDVRTYIEGDTVYMYVKWSYQQPSTVRLYTGTLSGAQRRAIESGGIRISGGAKVQ